MKSEVALITGATRGIGKAVARRFAREGHRLALVYRSNEDEAKKTESELKALGVDVLMLKADLCRAEACSSIVDATVERYGQIDVLVNNAGITADGAFALMKSDDYTSLVLSNSCAPFRDSRRTGS